MILNDAIEMTRQIAADSYVQLGEMRTARPSGPNPDAPHYLFIFEGPECPAGWSWYVNVSGKFKVAQSARCTSSTGWKGYENATNADCEYWINTPFN